MNLAKKLAHEETRKQLHRRLIEELHRTKDPRVTEDPIFEHSPYTDLTKPKGK